MSEYLITFVENLAPQSMAWAQENRRLGGHYYPSSSAALTEILEHNNSSQWIQDNEFILEGAWLDICLIQMASTLLNIHSAPQVTINTNRSILRREVVPSRHPLSSTDRLKAFHQLHQVESDLLDHISSGVLTLPTH